MSPATAGRQYGSPGFQSGVEKGTAIFSPPRDNGFDEVPEAGMGRGQGWGNDILFFVMASTPLPASPQTGGGEMTPKNL